MDLVASVSLENHNMERSLAHMNPDGEDMREAM